MSGAGWLILALVVLLGLYAAGIAWLWHAGRAEDARALGAFVPHLTILFRRLLGDPRVSASRKVLLALVLAYLASPIDLVPDFLPVVGYLDDAIIVALVLRGVLRSGGPQLVASHWPGPVRSLNVLLRLSGVPQTG